MKNEFIPYEQALELKELGFDDFSFGRFYIKSRCKVFSVDEKGRHYSIKNTPKKLYTLGEHFVLNNDNVIVAPLYQQAFRWFREKYGLYSVVDGLENRQYYKITQLNSYSKEYETYEEAELACLKKLIEIVKTK
jgi:hypothetical protein